MTNQMRWGRRPVRTLETISRGSIRVKTKAKHDLKRNNPESGYSLGVAKVVSLDYEEFYVQLRVLTGAQDVHRVPVPLTMPGIGARHFFGAMPQVGDYCVVGWMNQDSGHKDAVKIPVILTWMPAGTWTGREWATVSEFTEDELNLGNEKNRQLVDGTYARKRLKRRHIQPGNIVASSSQGSDLVLDEGVILSNRRGNEIRLRDQDQAIVLRSLQQFHAMAGARIYAGMVQRDALLLSRAVISDAHLWDADKQVVENLPIPTAQNPEDPINPNNFLLPSKVLQRKPNSDGTLGAAFLSLEPHLDPYMFLQRGGFINSSGIVTDVSTHLADAVYGGKSFYRVSALSAGNAVLDADKPTLTEWRLEVAHTTDGKLPVTEQTDMFDAERLPTSDPITGGTKTNTLPSNMPFIEFVLGSVVGNDPYSANGKTKYAKPIKAVIFDNDVPSPRLEPANVLATSTDTGASTPLAEHAATLFRLTPPTALGGPETFWSVNKKGQFKASIGGPAKENSVEVAMTGGMQFQVSGPLKLMLDGGIAFGSKGGDKATNVGLNLSSETGAVKIYGGGSARGSEAVTQRNTPVGKGERALPSVDIGAQTSARVTANDQILLKSQETEVSSAQVNVLGHQVVKIQSADRIEISASTVHNSHTGKRVDSYTGPAGGLPTSGPLHEKTYATALGAGTVDKATYVNGDREETFLLGSHTTQMVVGNLTFKTGAGTCRLQAGANTLRLSGGSGLSGTIPVGTINLTASGGAASFTGMANVTVTSVNGAASLRGLTSVMLGAPVVGIELGPILCAGTLDPLTGLPFSTWGLGAKKHLITP